MGAFTKEMAKKMAEEIVAKKIYTTICQGISKPNAWKKIKKQ